MFFRNIMKPAEATAGYTADRAPRNVSGIALDAESPSTDDFGTYGQPPRRPAPRGQGQRPPQRPPQRQGAGQGQGQGQGQRPPRRPTTPSVGFKRSSIIVALIAVVALIALISLVAIFVSNSGGDIKYENDAYLAVTDEAGISRVLFNGKVIAEYSNEIELILAEDRSFAYIVESGTEGYTVHVAKGKRIETITGTPVTKIITTASLAPAVVWLEIDSGIYLYTEEHGEERITKNHATLKEYPNAAEPYNYMVHISADGSTVTYAQTDTDTGDFFLYLYRDSTATRSTKYLHPVAISDDGKFVFGYGISAKDGKTKVFYVVSGEDRYLIDEGFDEVIAVNAEGNEIVYTTNTESGISTHIYAFKARKLDDDTKPSKIGSGICVPVMPDPEIARPATFKNSYFERIDGDVDDESGSPTYFVNRKYESSSICAFRGKFTTDGDYFYYLNDSDALQRIDLKDKSHTPEKIAEDIVDFVITRKDNVYWLSDSGRLSFYEASKGKTTRVEDAVSSISMHDYSNTLYFLWGEDAQIYTSEEGSKKDETASLDSTPVSLLPTFSTPTFKRCYAAVWDAETLRWNVFYTSNGRSFKLVASCIDAQGFDASELIENTEGVQTAPETNEGIG